MATEPTPPANELSLSEEMLLIAVDPERGRIKSSFGNHGVARAALSELMLRDRLRAENNRLSVHSTDPVGSRAEDRALELLAAQKPMRGQAAVAHLASKSRLGREEVLDGLTDRGLLRWGKVRRLLLFRGTEVELLDRSVAEDIRERVAAALGAAGEDQNQLDERSALRVALVMACALEARVVSGDQLRRARRLRGKFSAGQLAKTQGNPRGASALAVLATTVPSGHSGGTGHHGHHGGGHVGGHGGHF